MKLSKVFTWGFLFLYLLVACISFCHAIDFFNIGNVRWMSISLAFAFELGLALSLAAILLDTENKKNTLPWVLMVVLCFVQVIGNVFSTYKFIDLSGTDYYNYLAKPLLFWIEGVSEDSVRIIVSWIMGAILPIIALFMTDMVATNIKISKGIVEEPLKSVNEDQEIQETQETQTKKEDPTPNPIYEAPYVERKIINETPASPEGERKKFIIPQHIKTKLEQNK